jgi:hypothetical protein
MKTYSCKCGNYKFYGSGMNPEPCQGCEKCGTQAGTFDGEYRLMEPHDWKPKFNVDTGLPDRPRCIRCYARGPKPEIKCD